MDQSLFPLGDDPRCSMDLKEEQIENKENNKKANNKKKVKHNLIMNVRITSMKEKGK